jgi:hypothetical protein
MTDQRPLETPIAIIVFRRPEETRRLIDSLRGIAPKKIYVIADGPRSGAEGEIELVAATRAEVDKIDWPAQVIKVYSELNLGLRQRVLTGLDHVFDLEDEAIILEDDCIPAPSFFRFSVELLVRYRFNGNVSMICGSNFSPAPTSPESYFFYPGSFIWGWATWARTWSEFRSSPQVEYWSKHEQSVVMNSFSSKIAARAFRPMMENAKNLNTWDISLEVFLRQNSYVSAVPNRNLISNIGFGETATHTKVTPPDSQSIETQMEFPLIHPRDVLPRARKEKKMWRLRLARWLLAAVLHPVSLGWPAVKRVLSIR